jgi:hypothetical protein
MMGYNQNYYTAGDDPRYKSKEKRDWVFRNEDMRFVPLLNHEALVSTADLVTSDSSVRPLHVSLKVYMCDSFMNDAGSSSVRFAACWTVEGLPSWIAYFSLSEFSMRSSVGWRSFEIEIHKRLVAMFTEYTSAISPAPQMTADKLIERLKSSYLFEGRPGQPQPREGWEGFDGSDFPDVNYNYGHYVAAVRHNPYDRHYTMYVTLPTNPITTITRNWATLDEAMVDAESIIKVHATDYPIRSIRDGLLSLFGRGPHRNGVE